MNKKEILLVKNAISKIEVYPYFREEENRTYTERLEKKWYRPSREEGYYSCGFFFPIGDEQVVRDKKIYRKPWITVSLNNGHNHIKYFNTIEELEEYKAMLLSVGIEVITL